MRISERRKKPVLRSPCDPAPLAVEPNGASETVCPLPGKRRLTLNVAARVTRIGWAEPQTRRVSHERSLAIIAKLSWLSIRQSCVSRLHRGWQSGGRAPVLRRDRQHAGGNSQAGAEAGRQVRAGDDLLRGGADRLWAVPAHQEPWAGVHCGCPFAHSEEAGRPGEDESA
jgi:hypothetical protein